MPKKQNPASDDPSRLEPEQMVKVECLTSVKFGGKLHLPGKVIEMPLSMAEELEDGDAVERVFEVEPALTVPGDGGGASENKEPLPPGDDSGSTEEGTKEGDSQDGNTGNTEG